MNPGPEQSDIFNSTRWSVVAAAKAGDTLATKALNELLRIYWHPVYCYVRRRGHDAQDAEDFVQDYFASLLRRGYISEADRAKGRFRAFLLADLKLFLANAARKGRAEKRGGGVEILSFDAEEAELRFASAMVVEAEPDEFFDRQWAAELFESAQRNLAEDQEKSLVFEHLAGLLDKPPAEGVLAEVAAAIGSTDGAVKVALHRLRVRFAEILRALVRDTVADPAEAESELRYLLSVWSRSGGAQ